MCREESAADKENGSWVDAGGGRWETAEDANGYNWVPERTWVPKSSSVNVQNVQCYCSGNNSLCEHCFGVGTVRSD